MFSFDLRSQPWIPVRDVQGNLLEVSLHEALTNGANYLRIESENPLEVAALHRFLLAVLHRALRGPTTAKDNARWLRQGFPTEEIEAYLEPFDDRLDLFHPKYPFYQIPEMPSEGYTQHWSRLSTEFGSGNTSPLFNYAKRDEAPKNPASWVSPARAARLVLEHQTFCLGGLIKRFITSSPGAPTATAAHTLVQGDNLHQTLCLNLVSYPPKEYETDWVVWEAEPLKIKELQTDPKAVPRGLVHRYTWLSRSIRLFPEDFDGEVGVCTFAYASAVRPDGYGDDPLVAYRVPKKAKEGLYPLGLSKDRAFWRDFTALLPQKKGETADQIPRVINQALETFREIERAIRPKRGLVVEVYGQMSNQGKVETWRSEARRLPGAVIQQREVRKTVENLLLLSDEVGEKLRQTGFEFIVRQLPVSRDNEDEVARLRRLFHAPPYDREPQEIKNIRLRVAQLPLQMDFWSNLERRFYQLLDNLGEDYDEEAVEQQWKGWLLETASEAWDVTVRGAGTAPRALKAAAQAQGMFFAQLKKLRSEREKEVAVEQG